MSAHSTVAGTDLLVRPDGLITRLAAHSPEMVLAEQEVDRPIAVTMKQEEIDLVLWCGLDPTMPVNSIAREMVASLTGLHMIFFGPVVLEGLDEDLIREMLALYEAS